MTTAVADRTLTTVDRCDRCGAQAYVRVVLGASGGELLFCGHHARVHGLDASPGEGGVTTGSSGGFLLAFLAAFEAGDRVAIGRPGYPCYRNVLTALGCEPVLIETSTLLPGVRLPEGATSTTVPAGRELGTSLVTTCSPSACRAVTASAPAMPM